jgi:hypothetical protein
MLVLPMKPRGTYKIRYQRRETASAALADETPLAPRGVHAGASAGADDFLARLARSEQRSRRILDSLRSEIVEGGGQLRIRQVFDTPREIYRIELELPDMGYLRTTLLDREALEALLEEAEVQQAVAGAQLS